MPMIPITEQSLRIALRNVRNWQDGYPERQALGDWVTRGFQALEGSSLRDGKGRTMVFVRAYARSRGGKPHQVGAHTRSAPPHSADGGMIRIAGNDRRPCWFDLPQAAR